MEGVLKFEDGTIALITILLLLPGYLMRVVTAQALGKEANEGEMRIVELVVRSSLVASAVLLILLIAKSLGAEIEFDKLLDPTPRHLWIMLLAAFIGPIAMGGLEVLLIKKRPFEKLLDRSKIKLKPSPNTAWDDKFMTLYRDRDTESPRLVKVQLKGATAPIVGLLYQGSYASGIVGERDLYISRLFELDANGHAVEAQKTDGIWLSADVIESVQFWYT